MPLPRSLLQLDFDQYQRYAAVAVLLKPLIAASRRSLRDPVRILEVGCHALNLLPEFLAPFPVEVVRADVIEGLDDGSGPFVPLRSNEPYPFDDGSFDYAVALEVLEHLPAAGRPFVMSEWARVTRGGLFFSCPNGNRVRRAEHRVDADYRERHHGAPHPWLEEHERYGRPSRREVRTLCETAGLTPIRFLNSPLAEWLPLLLATERVREQGSAAAVQKLNELLNSRPFQAFIRRPAYRSLYAAFKSERLASDANKCWGQSQNRRRTAKRVDPVRLLSRTFADLLVEQDERAADKQRLGELVHLHAAQKHRLTKLERQNTWSRWELERQKTRRPASRRPSPLADAELHSLQPQGPGRWIADGPAPHFTILGDYRRGWHRITLAGRADAGRCAKLYLDYGSGFSHQHVVHLGLWPDGLARWSTYAYFHHPVCRLRLLPADAPTLLALDEFTVRSVPAGRVALAGFLRWWKGGAVVHPAAQPESFLRLCLRLPTVPRGLTTQSPTPYEAWLAAQRPSLADRQSIRNSLDTSTQATVAVFLQIQPDSDAEALRRTVQSLLAQDVLPCEVWVAVPQDYAADWQQSPAWVELNRSVHWLPYRPETPLSRQLHDCLRQCRATLLLPLRTGHVLEPDALVQFAFHAQEHPDAGLFYADEDVWDCWNGHSRPLLKPDASPETFHFQPQLLGSAVAVRCDALRSQGFHPAYEGALLPQYFLRLLDEKRPVVHLRRVLLHDTHPVIAYAPRVLNRLVDHHAEVLERHVADAQLPLVSIVIPSAGRSVVIDGRRQTHLGRCLASIRASSRYENYEILVVDNDNLPDEAVRALGDHGAVRIAVPGPFNFSRNLNHAVRAASGTHLLFLNDDTEVISPDWIERLLHFSCQDGVGVVGAKLYFPTGLLQHVGIALTPAGPGHPYYGSPGDTPGYQRCCIEPRNWIAATGACLMSSRAAFDAVAGFDESFELNYNDVDYCLRLGEAGYRCVVNPRVELYHFETMRADGRAPFRPEELDRFRARWAGHYPYDPHFTDEPCGRG